VPLNTGARINASCLTSPVLLPWPQSHCSVPVSLTMQESPAMSGSFTASLRTRLVCVLIPRTSGAHCSWGGGLSPWLGEAGLGREIVQCGQEPAFPMNRWLGSG
jgi:hypothetical protein